MSALRRTLLELWAIAILACVVGFLGPFGTYVRAGLVDRVADWWALLMGAYLLVRPTIGALRVLADRTSLPENAVAFSGVVAASAPLAMIWRAVGRNAFRDLDGYAALLPFSCLCALAVLGVARWASRANLHLQRRIDDRGRGAHPERQAAPAAAATVRPGDDHREAGPGDAPALGSRLSPTFRGPIVALQSEDHYVRVHGIAGSELLLMRLRDAVAEMDGVPGEQVHRSWWVARTGIGDCERSGRSWTVNLRGGAVAPVARDSVKRLQRSGFLPGD